MNDGSVNLGRERARQSSGPAGQGRGSFQRPTGDEDTHDNMLESDRYEQAYLCAPVQYDNPKVLLLG